MTIRRNLSAGPSADPQLKAALESALSAARSQNRPFYITSIGSTAVHQLRAEGMRVSGSFLAALPSGSIVRLRPRRNSATVHRRDADVIASLAACGVADSRMEAQADTARAHRRIEFWLETSRDANPEDYPDVGTGPGPNLVLFGESVYRTRGIWMRRFADAETPDFHQVPVSEYRRYDDEYARAVQEGMLP